MGAAFGVGGAEAGGVAGGSSFAVSASNVAAFGKVDAPAASVTDPGAVASAGAEATAKGVGAKASGPPVTPACESGGEVAVAAGVAASGLGIRAKISRPADVWRLDCTTILTFWPILSDPFSHTTIAPSGR